VERYPGCHKRKEDFKWTGEPYRIYPGKIGDIKSDCTKWIMNSLSEGKSEVHDVTGINLYASSTDRLALSPVVGS